MPRKMDAAKITYKYYSNPAFCAQSEVVYTQQTPCVSPRIAISPNSKKITYENKRIPPLGANSPRKVLPQREYRGNVGNHRMKTDISDNPLRNGYSKNDGPLKYVNTAQNSADFPPKLGPKPAKNSSGNLEKRGSFHKKAVNKRTQESNYTSRSQENLEMYGVGETHYEEGSNNNVQEETVMSNRIMKHRYAEIPDDYDDYSPTKKRIIETDPEEYNVDAPSEDEVTEIPTEIMRSVNGKVHRYAIIPSDDEDGIVINFDNVQSKPHSLPTFNLTSPGMSRKNLEATQKLHELLSTPKKDLKKIAIGSPLKSCSSSPSIRSQINAHNNRAMPNADYRGNISITPSKIMMSSTPKQKITPSKSCATLTSPPLPRRNSNLSQSISPKAQQKLNYDIPYGIQSKNQSNSIFYPRDYNFDRINDFNQSYNIETNAEFDSNRIKSNHKEHLFTARSTAVISPRMKSRGSTSIYSDGAVFPDKSWKPTPGCATLCIAAAMLFLCGGLTTTLSFYLIYMFGEHYYLNIGVISGFTCSFLGILGFFSSHRNHLLPNRNYISGYIVISIFSLLSCGALLLLLCLGPEWGGGALQGLVSGSVTAMGGLCLLLAVIGAISSYCCGHPPPDNRVADARGP